MRCLTREAKVNDTQDIVDDDVITEQRKALESKPGSYEILTKNLRKVYLLDNNREHKVAVDNLSFGIDKG